jgi:hypothetical protein
MAPLVRLVLPLALAALVSVVRPGPAAPVSPDVPELLPRDQEIALALSAAPEHLRTGAAVWVLEKNGFVKVRESTNGFGCIVNRDHPLNRKPTCYDAEGVATIVPKVLRVGELLMQGKPLSEINAEIAEGFRTGEFVSPHRPGVAYMLSGDIRRFDAASGTVVSFPPHVMFYAPNLTDEDIGSKGDGTDGLPFIAYQGPQGFMIMLPAGGEHGGHGNAAAAASGSPPEPAVPSDPLAWTVGRWEGTRTEAATGESAALHAEITSVLGGAGVEERLEVEEGTPHYRGLYLEVSDPKGGKSAITYVNERRRNFSRLEGHATARGGEWTSVTAVAPHGSRMHIERTGEDSWKRTQFVSEDGGKTWTVLFVDDLRRAR